MKIHFGRTRGLFSGDPVPRELLPKVTVSAWRFRKPGRSFTWRVSDFYDFSVLWLGYGFGLRLRA